MIYPLLVSLLGILVGFALRQIAPEELDDSKKYIEIFQLVMFVVIMGVVSYFLFVAGLYIYLIFVVTAVVFYYLKKKRRLFEVLIYGIIILSYFLINQDTLMASLIFLYGFPLGIKK